MNSEVHPKHLEYEYNCPKCGSCCEEPIWWSEIRRVGLEAMREWDEKIQCHQCGTEWMIYDTGE